MRSVGVQMRNTFLETMLLKLLHEQRGDMSFLSLKHRVAVDVAQPYLTREEIIESIRLLEDLGLIEERKNLLGFVRFSLTEKGERAFDESVFGTKRQCRGGSSDEDIVGTHPPNAL